MESNTKIIQPEKKSSYSGRLLARSTLKEDSKRQDKLHNQPIKIKNLVSEMSTLKDLNIEKMSKMFANQHGDATDGASILPDSVTNHNTLRKLTSTRSTMRANSPVTIGLSDLGTNQQFPLPTRPATTGRMLPHIGRRNVQRKKAVFYPKLTTQKDNKLISGSTPTLMKNDKKATRPLPNHVEITTSKEPNVEIPSSSLRRQNNLTKCILDPNERIHLTEQRQQTSAGKQKITTVSTLTPTPPGQIKSGGERKDLCEEKKDEPNIASDKTTKVYSSQNESSQKGNQVVKNFKPIISVQNLKIGERRPLEKMKKVKPTARSMPSRPLLDKEREIHVRQTYPIRSKESTNLELPTVMRGRQFPAQ
ncbi:uncharacterized protein LOC143465942 isoform X1 [Clavelina lepadiformis]|uniref:uncharacterized protein LOC143465942 isoform X1 n=2 Tax=Clavelina lepadiformis TaxID=159417 RepID=UPI004042EF14